METKEKQLVERDVGEVKTFYDENAMDEWERCERHPVEFAIATRYMDRYIKPGDSVLDLGGGPGRYSIYLAKRGCSVTLADLSDGNIALAKQKAGESGVDIRAFSCDARKICERVQEKFDHILLMGPLYHLMQEADRVSVVDQCMTLLKPGGTIFVSFISSVAGAIYYMKYDMESILKKDAQTVEDYRLVEENKEFSGTAFTKAYFIRREDVLPFMAKFPLDKLHLFGQESLLAPVEDKLLTKPQEVIDAWIDFAYKVAEQDGFVSYSEHFMYVGRRR